MKRAKTILLAVIMLFCIFKINKFFQYSLYSQISKDFIYAQHVGTSTHIWNSNEYNIVNYDNLFKDYTYLEGTSKHDFASGCNYPPKFIDNDHIVTGGFDGIFYINVKDQTLMRYVRMPYKAVFCFDVLDNRDIIFIFDGDIYTYDYKTDKRYKNENVNIKDIFKEYKPPVFSSCIAYSKKYNVILYNGVNYKTITETIKNTVKKYSVITSNIYAVNLNTNKVSMVGNGRLPQTDKDGNFYYADNNIIYEYFPDTNKSINIFQHVQGIFDYYSNSIRWFKKTENYIFIILDDFPNFKGTGRNVLFIYGNRKGRKVRIKVKETISDYKYNANDPRHPNFTGEMDIMEITENSE